jgi:hypothetical protein
MADRFVPERFRSDTSDPVDIEAELAYAHVEAIIVAEEWCRTKGPHKLRFLNDIRQILMAEDRQMYRMRLSEAIRTGAVKRTHVLELLTPSQALRLLECHKRATSDNDKIWKARNLQEMLRIESRQRRDEGISRIRQERKEMKLNDSQTE